MLEKTKEYKSKIKIKVMAMVLGLTSIVLLGSMLANAFATASDYYYDGVNVSVDGVQGATAYMYLRTVGGGTFYTRQGDFSISETNDANGYITLQSLTASGSSGQTTISDFTTDGFKRLIYADALYIGNEAGPNDPLMIAVYNVDKDTPAGDYTVSLSNVSMVGGTSGYGGEQLPDMTATIHVTRSDEPEPLPSQVVTFRDSEGNPITEISKYYGDADFTITKEVTTGDGAITEYHPDDDGSGSIVHTDPMSDTVGVGIPGDMPVCAWVEETENYAATKVCYTVHVLPRPLDIVGASIADKTYDATTVATVNSVSFADRNLSSDQYTATAVFADANAGNDKSVTVTVTLVGTGADYYALNSATYNTTKTISPYQLVAENVALSGSTYTYDPDGVEPEVTVTAPGVYGGTYTLTEDEYNVAYSDNYAAGTGHVSVTGEGGNFTTGEYPIMLDFTINKQGINNTNLNAPSSIVEHHILTVDEISVVVNGHTLTRCATDGATNCDYVLTISGDNDGEVGHVVNVAVNARNNYDGAAAADITIVAKLPQTVTISSVTGTTVNKSYGDADFTYTATSDGDGGISYGSSDDTVATVDANGKVTIHEVGEADITATAAETDTYAQGSASYHLVVSKKVVTVSSATVSNKTYDGTPVATVTNVTLSESSLVYGTDMTATGLFNDVTPAVRNVDVMVALSDDAYNHYCFTYESTCIKNTHYNATAAILQFTLSADNTTAVLNDTTFEYDGNAKEPTATVTVDLNGDGTKETTLVAGTDYEISYSNNVNAGVSAKATIAGKGIYTGSLSALTFTIDPAPVTNVQVTAPSQTYTGSALEPVPTVTGEVNGSAMTFDPSIYITLSHDDFINAGDYTFTIGSKVGSNYYIAHTNGTFRIEKATSSDPAEMTSGLSAEVGKTLADLGDLSEGFTWVDPTTPITAGMNDYPATYTKNGDTTNYTTVNVSVPVLGFTAEYDVVKGDGQNHIIGVDGAAEFEIDAEYSLFETGGSVYVDNTLVDPADYESWSSSTVISLSKTYLDGLALGNHTLAVLFNDGGVARASFTVSEPEPEPEPGTADTGVFTGVAGGAVATGFTALILAAIAGVVYKSTKKEA